MRGSPRGEAPWLEIHGGAERNLRPFVARKQPSDDREAAALIIVVVAVEVEERIAIITVDPDVPAGVNLQAAACMPAELSVALAVPSVDGLDRALCTTRVLPAGTAQNCPTPAASGAMPGSGFRSPSG